MVKLVIRAGGCEVTSWLYWRAPRIETKVHLSRPVLVLERSNSNVEARSTGKWERILKERNGSQGFKFSVQEDYSFYSAAK